MDDLNRAMEEANEHMKAGTTPPVPENSAADVVGGYFNRLVFFYKLNREEAFIFTRDYLHAVYSSGQPKQH